MNRSARPDTRKPRVCRAFGVIGGDGGNRTHVRDRVKDGFYERIRHSVSRPSVAIAGEVGRDQPQKMSPRRLRRTSGGDPASDSVESRRGLREPRFTA